MPKPYSEDLRKKALNVFDERKMTIKKICEIFNIDEKRFVDEEKKRGNWEYKSRISISKRT